MLFIFTGVYFFLQTAGGPDIKWVEGGRPLFRVNLRLVSTVYTQDQHLHNFFELCERLEAGAAVAHDMNSLNKIKVSLNVSLSLSLSQCSSVFWVIIFKVRHG